MECVDRISALPDEVILHILSFLTVDHAVPTSVLSQRWRYLWTFNPTMHFPHCIDLYGNKPKCSIATIARCIKHYKADHLQHLKLSLFVIEDASTLVRECFDFAIRTKVKSLHVYAHISYECFDDERDEGKKWVQVPSSLFSLQSLEKLSLGCCELRPPLDIKCFHSLKHLSLLEVTVFDGALETLLSKCRALQYLLLSISYESLNLSISLPYLQQLHINIYESQQLHTIDICARNLRFIFLTGRVKDKLCLENAPHLQEAAFHFQADGETSLSSSKDLNFWGPTLQNIKNLKVLKIKDSVFKVMLMEYYSNGNSGIALDNLKEFDCVGFKNPTPLHSLVCFFRNCPSLVKLELELYSKLEPFVNLEQLPADTLDYERELISAGLDDCMLDHLKHVKITDFAGDPMHMAFIKFILNKAKVLDELYLQLQSLDEPIKPIEQFLINYLFMLPKLSKHATIKSVAQNGDPILFDMNQGSTQHGTLKPIGGVRSDNGGTRHGTTVIKANGQHNTGIFYFTDGRSSLFARLFICCFLLSITCLHLLRSELFPTISLRR